jgi:hypothetical protein
MFLIISILGFGRKNSVQALNLVNFCGIMSFWEEIVGIDCEANPFSVQKGQNGSKICGKMTVFAFCRHFSTDRQWCYFLVTSSGTEMRLWFRRAPTELLGSHTSAAAGGAGCSKTPRSFALHRICMASKPLFRVSWVFKKLNRL